MKKAVLWILSTLLLVVLWAVGNFFATTQGWLLSPVAKSGDQAGFTDVITLKIDQQYLGNASMVLLKKGEIVARHNVSKGREVTSDTVFGVASLSKWVAAVGIMKLVEQGKLELDAPVSTYLTRWQLPESEFNNDGVTIRRLLSHTAGITDGLGHDGFAPGSPVQPLVEHLTQAKDADPGRSGRVEVGVKPGTQWIYSGGSYNLMQLIVEEVTGESFAEYMHRAVFQPLGMSHSGYQVERQLPQTAEYFDADAEGGLRIYPNYTSLAATGLYSTANDLVKFVRAQIPSHVLTESGNRLLSDQTLALMRQPIGNVDGLDIWGAGVMLFAENGQGDFVVGHGGQSPKLNSTARFDPATGNGFVMLQTGNPDALASDMATRWTVWETGKPDMYILRNTLPEMIQRVFVGSVVIVLLSIVLAIIRRLRGRSKSTATPAKA